MYKYILKPILFLFDPEFIHDCFIWFGENLGRFPITRWLVSLAYGYHGPNNSGEISKTVDGIEYRTSILLAAGFDYNGRLTRILSSVGFAGEEIGSVTARPCAGNSKPRMTRLPKSGSIIVNKGLRNDGVDAIIKRLKSRGRISNFIVGVSIARTNDEKSSSLEAGIADYVYSFKRLNEEGIGDYYTINISCPNAFGGEAFTEPELLEKLLSALKTVSCKKPVYVKMPINKSWEDFRNLLDIIIKYGLQGVVIGNLNKDYSYLGAHAEVLDEYAGGLSGKPCEELSNELIRKTRQYFNEMLASEGGANKKRPTIIGVGGIDSVESAKKKFEAGADLIQLITGMIYEGPGLIKKICRGLTSAL